MTRITIELGGGLDHLFGGVKVHEVDVPAASASASSVDGGGGGDESAAAAAAGPLTVARLLSWAREHLLKERPELFMKGESVRPGIIVLINDCDWELCGGLDSALQDGDRVVFISTLHGG